MSDRIPGELRIIAGKWRGRKLKFLDRPSLRPTPDRVRETLFNWLQSDIVGCRCIDLFAGSGALGFEAISRGATSVIMIEKDAEVIDQISRNIELLSTDQIEVYRDDAMNFLEIGNRESKYKFDLVFMDPPYRSELLEPCCKLLEQGQWLEAGSKVYIEYSSDDTFDDLPSNWECLKKKQAGQVGYSLYIKSY